MKSPGQRYVQYANLTYQHSGTLWDRHYRSCPVNQEAYLLAGQSYIEFNPVRADMVMHPADYPWSQATVQMPRVRPARSSKCSGSIRHRCRMRHGGKRRIGRCSGTKWSPHWWIRFGERRMATLCWVTSALPGRLRRSLAAGQCRESRDDRASALNQSPEPYLMGDTRVNVNL